MNQQGGFFGSLPARLRRLLAAAWAVVFLGAVFYWVPRELAELNDARGWPRWQNPVLQALGVVLFVGGLALSLYCSRLFARVGKGTPVPMDPPTQLVVSGIYRHTRNPIYVAQVAVLLSYFLWFGQLALLVHAVAWALLVEGFIVWFEEPGLHERFGAAYEAYTREVPRWIG
jgi:protein-S-isoprenylcysteine O-methyltransferase Ste14